MFLWNNMEYRTLEKRGFQQKLVFQGIPVVPKSSQVIQSFSGWWFGTFFIFDNIWDNPSH